MTPRLLPGSVKPTRMLSRGDLMLSVHVAPDLGMITPGQHLLQIINGHESQMRGIHAIYSMCSSTRAVPVPSVTAAAAALNADMAAADCSSSRNRRGNSEVIAWLLVRTRAALIFCSSMAT